MGNYHYPEARVTDVTEDWFGTELADPYQWLKEAASEETLAYVAAENAFTDQYFERLPVAERIKRLKEQAAPELPSMICPWKDGYLGTCVEEGEYQIWILDRRLNRVQEFSKPQIIADRMLFQVQPDPCDSGILALMTQIPGAARPTVVIYDMDHDTVLHEIDETFSFCWSRADGCLYYSSTDSDAEKQSCHSRFLRFDPKTGQETVVYEDDSYAIFGQVFASRDGKYLQMMICQDYAHAIWVSLDISSGTTVRLCEEPGEWTYMDSTEEGHYFVSMTNHPYGAVIRVPLREEDSSAGGSADSGCSESGDSSQVLLEGSRELILEQGFSAGGILYVLAKHHVSSRLLYALTGEEVPLFSEYAAVSLAGETADGVILKQETFLQEPVLAAFGERTDFREAPAYPGEMDQMADTAREAKAPVLQVLSTPSRPVNPDLVAEQHFAPSTKDQTPVPYYIVYKKGIKKDGSHPALLYAYGGYNISMPPWSVEMVTQIRIADWVEAGGIYVHINNRGGNEYGPAWHEAGMRQNKRHCYEDFIGVAEQLIRDGWTDKGKMGIAGCSNGGLLMSALVTMRPDLWGCVIDSVPHTDMIHFAEDDRGPMYITEYGNPRESREMFSYLLSYSPYHNVRETAYPPVYIQTGEKDNNVPPYHGKKLAARMQALNTADTPVLLRVLAQGSHDRGRGEDYWRTIAEMQTFLSEHLQISF